MKKSVITASLIVGICIVTGVFLLSQILPGSISKLFAADIRIGADRPPIEMDATVKAINNAMMNVSQAVVPTVVSITVDIEKKGGMNPQMDERFKEFFKYFGIPEDEQEENPRSKGAGSGVVFTSDGYIVTNNHVVEDAIEGGIKVQTLDKKEYSAKLIGRDPLTDLAVLKINANNLQAAHFGDLKDVKVGEMVLAVGNPLGLNSTVTSGIVSAVGRGKFGGFGGAGKSQYSVEHFIQTDAAINPGNSGGGLYNLNGSLIGINTAIATGTGSYIGYGFAIPIDLVRTVIQDIVENGKIDRGYIGVQIRNVDETDATTLGLKDVKGVLVTSVVAESAAKKAGIQSSDVILEVDGQEVNSSNELQSRIVFKRAGDEVKLTIWRDEKIIYKTVKLLPQTQEEDVSLQAAPGNEIEESNKNPVKFDQLGFSVKPLEREVKKKYDVEKGVYVSDVKRYSPAAERGLYTGAVIIKADRKDIESVQKLKDIVNAKKPGETLLLQVKYEDITQIVTIKIPD